MKRIARALGVLLSFVFHNPKRVLRNNKPFTGFTLAPNFNRRCSHLFCPVRKGAKFDKAIEWDIPVVGSEWINRMVREGIVPEVFGYEDLDRGKGKDVNGLEPVETTKSK
jgi:hypothetical protein